MEKRVLVLTAWYFPYQILGWQDAITQLYTGDTKRVVDYNEVISTSSVDWPMPAVTRLVDPKSSPQNKKGKFSRFNVFTRDRFRCQYCNERKVMSELTYDHVTPRARGGQTVWTNIVTACTRCNSRKGQMTCDEAGMFPRNRPVKPKRLPMVPPIRDLNRAPAEWHDWLRPYLQPA